jgi:N utilization substance protein A
MDEVTAHALAERNVVSVEDLADQAVDDLIDIEGMTEEHAAALIMAARKPMIEQLEKGG